MPLRRLLAAGFVALAVLALSPVAQADPLADAKARQQKLQAELDKATRELAELENRKFWSDKSLQAARGRLGRARLDLATAEQELSGHLADLYKAGGTSPISSILASDSDVVDRVEFEEIMLDRQVNSLKEAKVARDSYERATRDVRVATARSQELQQRTKLTVARLSSAFQAAKQVLDKLQGFNKTLLYRGRFYSCPVSPPYSYIDSWGFARSGGRSHKGTDIMNAYGNKIHAVVDGKISRFSTSSLGGITLYMQGVDGDEYYYAHLSRYAAGIHPGTPVKAGELIAYNGSSGNASATAPHLHFEYHPGGGAPVNPYSIVVALC
ncbi:MAG TPA: peptidoglycan DD-metalloendopeptidase family protein [Actinomycetota bacterium]|nr:peptidoglycan DD-metalloendopeptidase family protein [Actinomycetota bacterium]